VKDLPERLAKFKEGVVDTVLSQHPELAKDLGVGRLKLDPSNAETRGNVPAGYRTPTADEDFATIVDGLNKGRTSQGFSGAVAGALGTAGLLPGKNGEDADRALKSRESLNQLSAELNRSKTQIFGTDAAAFGQGAYSVAEAIGLGAITGGEGALPALARLEKLGGASAKFAKGLTAASRVAPIAGLSATKQGIQTYDQAISAGKTPVQAAKLAATSAAIEFGVTTVFSAFGHGGTEAVGQQLVGDAAKKTFATGVKGFIKGTAKGILDEQLEENLIAAWDAAAVQSKINPDMTVDDFLKNVKDTALVTLAVSGPASAIGTIAEMRRKPTHEQSTDELKARADITLAEATKPSPADPMAAGSPGEEAPPSVRAVDTPANGTPVPDAGERGGSVRDAGQGATEAAAQLTTSPAEEGPSGPSGGPAVQELNAPEPIPTPQSNEQDEGQKGQGRQEVLTPAPEGDLTDSKVTPEQTEAEWIAERKAQRDEQRRVEHAAAGPEGERLIEIEDKWKSQGVEVVTHLGKDSIELTVLEVPKDDRGKGKGSAVLDDLKALSDETGKPVVLHAENTEPGGRQPHGFYEKNGFESTGKDKYRYNPKTGEKGTASEASAASPEPVEPKNPEPEVSKTESPETGEKVTTSPEVTGIKNAITEQKRKERGFPERTPTEKRGVEVSSKEAAARIAENPNEGRTVVAKFVANPQQAPTDVENDILVHETMQREKAHDSARKRLEQADDSNRTDRLAALEQAESDLLEIYKVRDETTSGAAGRALQSRKNLFNEDFTPARMIATEQKSRGRPLTEEERSEVLTRFSDKLEQLGKDIEAARDEIARASAERTFANQAREAAKTLKAEAKAAKAAGESRQSFLDRQAEAAKQRILERKRQGRLQANLDPTDIFDHAVVMVAKGAKVLGSIAEFTAALVKEFGEYAREHAPAIFKKAQEISKQALGGKVKSREEALSAISAEKPVTGKMIYDLARAHLEEGMDGFENVMKAVHEDLKSTHPDLTLREVHDAYSGYGKVKFPSKDEVKQKLRDYKNLSRLTSQLEDVQKGLAPLKTGPQRDAMSDRARRLQATIKEEMRRLGIKPPSNGKALRSGLDAVKARLRNTLADFKNAIETGIALDKTRTPTELDDEAKRLQKEVADIRKTYEATFGDEKLSDAKKAAIAEKLLDRAIAVEEDLLARGLASKPSGKESSAWSKAISEKRERLQQLRDDRARLRKARKLSKDPVDEATARLNKLLDKQLQQRRDIVRTGNLKEEGPETPEKAARREVNEKARQAAEIKAKLREKALLDELVSEVRAAQPETDEAGRRKQAATLKRLGEKSQELERQINSGDLAPKIKAAKPGVTDPVEARLRQDIARQQDTIKFLRKVFKEAKNPELVRLERLKKTIANRIAKTQARIDAGDFAPQEPKPPVSGDRALEDLRLQEIEVKRQFNQRQLDLALANRKKWEKAKDFVVDVFGVPRALMTSFDFGAVLRQGGFLTLGDPARLARNLPANFKAFASDRGAQALEAKIKADPFYAAAQKAGLYLADWGDSHHFSKLEEAYRSRLAKNIPLIGRGVRASERAYSGYLNALRMDTFSRLARSLTLDGNMTPEGAKAIANFVNIATGRGDLGKSEGATQALATIFFSPKYVASRFQLIYGALKAAGDAATGFAANPQTRAARKLVAKEYAKFLIGVGTVLATVAGVARFLYDDKDKKKPTISLDPRSSDFLKIKMGNTRIDLMAGLSQTTTFLGRVISGQTAGEKGVRDLRGDNVAFKDRGGLWDVGTRFLRSKLAPIPGTAVNLFTGRDVTGQKVRWETELLGSLLPLSGGDIMGAMQEQGVPKGTALGLLGIFGAGVQTYGDGIKPLEQQLLESLGVPESRYKEVKKSAGAQLSIPPVKRSH